MSKYKAYQWWVGLPGWAKGLVAVGGVIAGYSIYKEVKKSVNRARDLAGARKEMDAFKSDDKKLAAQGINPSWPDSQYAAWASELQKTYSGCDPLWQSGTSTGKIFKQLKNDRDFVKLVNAWGVRTFKGCLWESNFEGSFYQAISSETMGVTRDALNMQLKANGITYRV